MKKLLLLLTMVVMLASKSCITINKLPDGYTNDSTVIVCDSVIYDTITIEKDSVVISVKDSTIFWYSYIDSVNYIDSIVINYIDSTVTNYVDSISFIYKDSVVFYSSYFGEEIYNASCLDFNSPYKVIIYDTYTDVSDNQLTVKWSLANVGQSFKSEVMEDSTFKGVGFKLVVYDSTKVPVLESKNAISKTFDIFESYDFQNVFSIEKPEGLNNGYYAIGIYYDSFDNLFMVDSSLTPAFTYETTYTLPDTIVIEAEDFVDYYDIDTINEGGEYRDTGVDIEENGSGGYSIGWIKNGEWWKYQFDVFETGYYDILVYLATMYTSGEIQVDTTTIGMTTTSSWFDFQYNVIDSVYIEKGTHELTVTTIQEGFNFDKILVVKHESE